MARLRLPVTRLPLGRRARREAIPKPPRGRLARIVHLAAYTGRVYRVALDNVTVDELMRVGGEEFLTSLLRCIVGRGPRVIVTARRVEGDITDCMCPDGRRYEYDCRVRRIVIEYQGRKVELTFVG